MAGIKIEGESERMEITEVTVVQGRVPRLEQVTDHPWLPVLHQAGLSRETEPIVYMCVYIYM